jgi:hypothetical protein
MSEPALLSTVALLEDLPEKSLQRGQVGTVVEILAPGVYEVEFSDDSGQTYASTSVKSSGLLLLFHQRKSRCITTESSRATTQLRSA